MRDVRFLLLFPWFGFSGGSDNGKKEGGREGGRERVTTNSVCFFFKD